MLSEAGAEPAIAQSVRRLILATRHDAMPEEHDARAVVDIDLAILGAAAERYQRFEEEIRAEYA
ncbi:MAG: hypothetical protein KGJ78_14025 [Alphaproteobacteria bacterium]|nr:hypothetical protein [Alphaproteobacteria bacterium]